MADAPPPNFHHLNRCNSATDCSISLKSDIAFDHLTADVLQTFKVKIDQSSRSQRDVTYQQEKRCKSRTDSLTEFKLGENYPSAEWNM